ncbi:MAG: chromosomal replication initiator protein DnaA [Clostridia bacterium]|nr:chromosomal replication initiator protein DnaA [Clostridia bacterium]
MEIAMKKWEDICAVIISSEMVEKFQFDTWIDPISRVSFREDTLYVWAPSPVTVRVLENNYTAIIKEATFKVMKKEYDVVILDPSDEIPVKKDVVPASKILEPRSDTVLNPKYTFRTFVVGSSNKLAHAYALMVAECPGDANANPLFLYGGAGLGKTHLSQAIGHFMRDKNKDANIIYVAAETYTNEYIHSLQHKTTERFRDKYRNADLLIVDDIQFISGKKETTTEFFQLFNELLMKNKQVVLTSDRFPKQLQNIEERLVSRFISGITCDITKPDFETRLAILQNNCAAEQVKLSPEIIQFIAEKIKSNVRELEGALNKIIKYLKFNDEEITLSKVELLLKDYVFTESDKEDLTYDKIKEEVATYFGISVEDIMSSKKVKNIALARQIAMFIAFNKVKNTNVTAVAREFERDHSTISHAVQKINNAMNTDEEIATTVQDIISKLTDE